MRFEIGREQQFWEIGRIENVLQQREGSGRHDPAPRYRIFPDPEAAQAELESLARKRYAQGFLPADAEAKQLVSGLKPEQPATPVIHRLPLRRDAHVYNKASGFLWTSKRMAAAGIEAGTAPWQQAVMAGDILPMSLAQAESFNVRVVAGDTLSAEEEEEWVAKLEWRLHIPDGELCIIGGAKFVLRADHEEEWDERLRVIVIPPGWYSATVYSYVPGVNGTIALDHLAGGCKLKEPPGKWFRRTRAGEKFPPWLHNWCVGDPLRDPGCGAEWTGQPRIPDDEMPAYIDFLLHLERMNAPEKATDPVRPREDEFQGGWFGEAVGARKPERCPLGLEARDMIGASAPPTEGGWIHLWPVPAKVKEFELSTIEGGPVHLSAARLADVYRLAVSAHSLCACELNITIPRAFDLRGSWPKEVIALRSGENLHIAFSNYCRPRDAVNILRDLEPRLAALPEGTEVTLDCAQIDDAFDAKVPPGLQRYRGRMHGGTWQIDAAFPALDAATLSEALALSAEVAAGEAITVRSEDEAAAILKWAKGNHGPFIAHNPPTVKNGKLALEKPEPGLLGLYGSSAFAVRHRNVWPVLARTDDEEDAGGDSSAPKQGAKIP